MHIYQQLEGGHGRLDHRDRIAHAGPVDGTIHRREPSGTLGVHLTSGVLEAPVIRHE